LTIIIERVTRKEIKGCDMDNFVGRGGALVESRAGKNLGF